MKEQMTIHDDSVPAKSPSRRMIVFLVAVLAVIIIVGVLAGVLSANRERDKCDERIDDAVRDALAGQDKNTTTVVPTESSTVGPTESSTVGPTESSTKAAVTTTSPVVEPWEKIRLPKDIVPEHYDMLIRVYLDNLTFSGNSNITIEVKDETDKILFHINKINITSVVVSQRGTVFGIKDQFPAKKRQFYVVILDRSMTVGQYDLRLTFVANVETQELNGLYKSTYKNSTGGTRVLVATDFQPTDARKAFPCFDEPAMKATFTISIEHRSDYTALSNMNEISSEIVSDGRKLTRFAKSVRMPTYLVGMIVSDFEHLSDNIPGRNGTINIRTWATPLQYKDSEYALHIGKNVTLFLEEYYGVAYPLPKQDMIAVPDFNSGAMENWGIITYRESALLYKKGVSSETNKQRIALIVAHELAHMWFGNLVSCSWWNDIWLNEGFASYVEYLGTDHAEPDWEFMEQFLINDLHRAFRLDALTTSHPITVNVEDPEDIKTVFDAITYSKGSSIIRMLSDYLTEDKFKEGLQYYLRKNIFGSAETKDLWNDLTNISKSNVTEFMETWTEQMGYPVINITRSAGGEGKADQKHFLLDPNANVTEPSKFNYKWNIKVSYITGDNPSDVKVTWMNRTSGTFNWPNSTWIKANHKQYGYYRVNYERDNWEKLIQALKGSDFNGLPSSDRTSLIDDAFNLARAGQLDYDIPLNLSSYIKKEDKYVPWRAFMTSIGFLDTMLSTQDSYGKFQKYMLDMITDKITKVGWENVNNTDKHLEVYMRSLILSRACSYGHENSSERVKELFMGYLENNKSLDVDLKSMIYYNGIANTGYEQWDKLFEIYRTATAASEKSKLLYGLAGSKEPWILRRFLRYSIDGDKVRDQDTVSVVSYVAGNSVGRELAWKFLKENWETFYIRYAKSSFRMASVITSTTSMMNKKIDLEDVKAFFKDRDAGSGARAVDQAIERIKTNIEWVERSAESIADYLNKKY